MRSSSQACWCVATCTSLPHEHQTLSLSPGLLRQGSCHGSERHV